MREVAPSDIIFSFRDTRIAALGIARSYCYESPKPTEFGAAGRYWEAIGRKIDMTFREVTNRITPRATSASCVAARSHHPGARVAGEVPRQCAGRRAGLVIYTLMRTLIRASRAEQQLRKRTKLTSAGSSLAQALP